MCEFVSKVYLEGEKIQTKYRILGFEFENTENWFFRVRPVAVKVHGRIYLKEAPDKIIAFPKRRAERENGETYDVDLMPPRFYHRLKDKTGGNV